jgi:pyruvate dehydrogenase E2 component (dihydrolipoamide acetyltransferase)
VIKIEFEFPDTGEGVTEGKFLEWKVGEGDEIEEDQVVGEAETDKAVVEIPAPSDGVIQSLLVSPGDTVEVGEVIMEIDTGEDSGQQEAEEPTEESEEEENRHEEKPAEFASRNSTSGKVLAMPRVRKYARENGVDLEEIEYEDRIRLEDVKQYEGSSKTTEDSEKTDQTAPSAPEDVKATPSVRRFAREQEVDLSRVEGSGKGGKILREDVKNFSPGSEPSNTEKVEGDETVELSSIRKQIAEKMSESRFSAPHVTHVDTADVTELVEKRSELNESLDTHLTYTPFIIKAVQVALEEFPDLNAHFDGENSEVVRKASYDFNLAVDTDHGLMTPLLENVGEKNLLEIAEEEKKLVEKAQNREISPGELQPGSFSITNIGVIGGEAFTPIINPPQTAILGVGKIEKTPQVVDGEVVPRDTMTLSLSYDHRVIDGATGARFTNRVIELLETPEKMLVEMS